MRFTIEELFKEYKEFGYIKSLENVDAIYKVYMPENFLIEIRDTTDGIYEYKNESMLYEVEKLNLKWNKIFNGGEYGHGLLYIGKAKKSRNRGLRSRVTEFVRYGYREVNNHRGGRAIWQLENNKKLLIEVIECDNPRDVERNQLLEYKNKHGVYPFANWSL